MITQLEGIIPGMLMAVSRVIIAHGAIYSVGVLARYLGRYPLGEDPAQGQGHCHRTYLTLNGLMKT